MLIKKHVIEKFWRSVPYRILLLAVSIFIGLFIFAELLIDPILNSIVKPKLIEKVNDPNYHLSIDKLGYSIFNNSLYAENVFYTWEDTSDTSVDSSSIFLPQCIAKGISIFDLIFNSSLSLSELELNKPKLFINEKSIPNTRVMYKDKKDDDSLSSIYRSIYRSFPEKIKPFSINNIKIISGTFKKRGEETISIGSLDIIIEKFSIHSFEKKDSLHLMFCESLILKANDINFFFPEVKSIAKIKSLNISSRDSLFELDSFSFQPTEEDIDFFKGNKYRNDRWEIYIKELKCSSFNLSKYIWEKIIQIENISIDAGYLDILTNMRLQLPPNFNPKMPQEIINEINFDLNLRHIDLNIDSIVTRELYPYYDQPSRLPFKNIKGEIFNLSSMTGFQNQRIPSIFKISALLAGEGVLKINMEIPLSGGRADFNYSGSLGEMTVHPLNDHLIISDLVQLTSGKIDSVIFNVISKKGLVSVSIAPYYKKLKIKNIDKETMKGSGVLNAIQTFIANTFKIRVENPDKSDILKKGDEIYKIKEEDTFLDIIWESLKKALGEVVGF